MLTSQLHRELLTMLSLGIGEAKTRALFLARLQDLNLTRVQDQKSHFSVYFVPVRYFFGNDPWIFIGLHKKAQQFLAPGGHIEHDSTLGRDERCIETLHREFSEEFGVTLPVGFSINPFWISVTKINNERQSCKLHYDVWYAINVEAQELSENPEFEFCRWIPLLSFPELKLIEDPATISAFQALERYLKSNVLESID